MKSFALLTLLAPLAVLGHFTLDYPPSRGFNEDLEPTFCGGFPSVALPRQPFPLGSAPLLIDSHHLTAVVAVLISFDANPTSFANFNQTSSGVPYPLLKSFGTINGVGEYCLNVNVGALNVPGVGNGTAATLLVEFNGGDGALFQCADVVLSSTFTASNVACVNGTSLATPPTTTPVAVANSSMTTASTSVAAAAASTGATAAAKSGASQLAGSAIVVLGAIGMMLVF